MDEVSPFIVLIVYVLLCVWAYKCGVRSGNTAMSVLMMILGITFFQGLCHFIGTSKHRRMKIAELRSEVEEIKSKMQSGEQ